MVETKIARYYNGKLWKLKKAEKNKTYYTMRPYKDPKTNKIKTKRKWLGRDEIQATIKFNAFWDAMQEKEKVYQETDVLVPMRPAFWSGMGEMPKRELTLPVDENIYYTWLRNKVLEKKFQELADGTGFHNFVRLPEIINHTFDTPLELLYKNYTNSRKYKRSTDADEKKKTKKAWELFVSLHGKLNLEQITKEDVEKYENYLHSQDYLDRTIHHYKSRVVKVLNRNKKKSGINKPKLLQVLEYFSEFEDLEINSSNSIAAQVIDLEDFQVLYDNASLEMKAVMMLCLNTATYIIEVARFKRSDINFKHQTLMTQRNKTGQCRKFAYLWNRTVKDLEAYLATRTDKTDVLFIAKHGTEYKDGAGLRTKWWKLRDDCDLLHIKFNHLRDTFETVGKEIGTVSQYHIDMVMGHSSGKTSERYTHRRIHNELKKACLRIEKDYF